MTSSVQSGGTSSDAVVQSGGTLDVLAGGVAVDTTVQSGGWVLLSGGSASGTVLSGGSEAVSTGGIGVDEVIGFGGFELVSSGGTTSGDMVSGGTEALQSGAVVSGTQVLQGMLVLSGGTASATTIASGGFLTLSAGTTVGDIVSGGTETVRYFSPLSGAPVPLLSAGLVEAGGYQILFDGEALGATIGSGGIQYVEGGVASATTVGSLGIQSVFAGEIAANDTVVAGGVVYDSGELAFTDSAGSVAMLGGRVTGSGVILQSGGGTLVLGADTSSNYVDSGFTGAISLAAGTVELTSAGAAGSGSIGFADSALAALKIDGTAMPTNVISGFVRGDSIDLAGIAYATGGTVTASANSVSIVIGGGTYVLDIANAAGDGTFRLAQAGDGSTVLTDTVSITYVSRGVTAVVSSGVTSSGLVVRAGGTVVVKSGGTAVGTTVLSAGRIALSGGHASGTMLSSGANETIFAGGVGIGELVSAGGTETLSSGGTASAATISGGTEIVLANAVASGVLVKEGTLLVSGGRAVATTVASGGFLMVSAGTTSGDVVSGGTETLRFYGAMSGASPPVVSGGLVEAGGAQFLDQGSAVGATIGSLGIQYVAGGLAIATTIASGGIQYVEAGEVAVNDTVMAGGTAYVTGELLFNDAAGSSVTLGGGRVTGSGVILQSGGGTLTLAADVASNYTDSGFTGALSIAGGFVELTSAGAAGTGSIGFAAGSQATLKIDGTAMPTNVIAGFLKGDIIDLAGVAYSSAATVSVAANAVTISTGGASYVLDLASAGSDGAFHLAKASDGSTQLLDSAGGATVSSGVTSVVSSGSTASGLVVMSGGTLVVLTGGVAVSASVLAGGAMVLSGGRASGTQVSSGGAETVAAGGVGSGEVVSAGGTETVWAGGTTSAGIVAGGTETVMSGGVASNALIETGLLLVSGGRAVAATVASGGFLTLSAGSATGDVVSFGLERVDYQLPLSGSQLPVLSGSLVEAGGTQDLDNGVAVGAVIGSLGIQYVAGGLASATTIGSGGIQYVEAGQTARDDAVVAGGLVYDTGELVFTDAAGSAVVLGGRVTGGGVIVQSGGGTLVLSASVSANYADSGFTGALSLAAGTVELTSAGAAGTGDIGFAAGGHATLRIDGTIMPGNTISGLLSGDVVDLAQLAYGSSGTVTLAAGNRLQVTQSGTTETLLLDPAQDFAGTFFHLSREAAGTGTLVSLDGAPCYCPGTLIRTACGERPVERLAIGDHVATWWGAAKPIRWLGRRRYAVRVAAGRRDILPVCFKAGALADGVPRRDLFVSPLHAMFLQGCLVPAGKLVNGISVVQAEAGEPVEYIHIELLAHDVIWAEGAAAETFLDDGNRAMFHNAADYAARYPAAAPGPPRYCAPRLEAGYELEAIRHRIAMRAGGRGAAGLRGSLDEVWADGVHGWAQNPMCPEAAICLDITVDGVFAARTLANRFRPDLARAGLGSGRHAFEAMLPRPLPAGRGHVVEVRRTSDGVPVRNSPWRVARVAPVWP